MVCKIGILFWKNLLIRKNHYILTAVEVLLPVGLILLLNLCVPKYDLEIDNNPISFEAYKDKQCFPRHSHYGSVIYEPSTPFTDILMMKVACYAGYKKTNVKPGSLSGNNTYFSIGVKFENIIGSSVPSVLNYTLFPTNKALINLQYLWQYYGSPIPKYSIPTLYSVVEVQRAIDTSFLYLKNLSSSKLLLENTDVFARSFKVHSVPIILTLIVAFSLIIPPTVSRVVQEKETGAKELMLMMGILRWELWLTKFMDVIMFNAITVTGMVVFLCFPLQEDSNHFTIPPIILWSVSMYGLIGVIFFLFFITCFFEKSSLAVYVTEVIWLLSFIYNVSVSVFVELPLLLKYLTFFFPHIALIEGITLLIHYDFYGKEIKLMETLSGREDALPMLNILLVMTANIVLYAALTWYLEQVRPGKFGVPQPYNFLFKKSYWIPRKVLTQHCSETKNNLQSDCEPVSESLKPGICLRNISKVYKSKEKDAVTAVNNVCLDFYYTEITGLLGHNGAGKTTIFSMITGLSYPTSGKIMINGFDLGVNICEARKSLGLCPQHDMLFSCLTPIETLKFYGVVKGLSFKEATNEAVDLITRLKLIHVKNTKACNLSGGQKRKVSLAISLIGGSEVLVLDEPTAGMDPEIRREIWDILLELRKSRTILLTTHFMEEADALCDRIAIMDHGKIKCYGSPMYLKSKFTKGYVLSVVVPDVDKSEDVTRYVIDHIPLAKFKSQNTRTLYFELQEDDVIHCLPELEQLQKEDRITSFCLSVSTLEDVFLRLSSFDERKNAVDVTDSPDYKKLNVSDDLDWVKTPKCVLFFCQFWALMMKKWISFQRSYKSFLTYSIIPFLLIVISSLVSSKNTEIIAAVNPKWKTSLTYSLDIYPSSLVLYSVPPQATFDRKLFENLVNSTGSKAKKVNNTKQVIHDIFEDDFYTYAKKVILAVDYSQDELHIYHNEDAVHMVPILLNFIHNFLLKMWYKDDGIVTSIDVRYANKELFVPRQLERDCRVEQIPDISGSQTMFFLLAPLKERLDGAKEMQLMVTSAFLYWFAHFLFDFFFFFCYSVMLFLGVGAIESDEMMLKPPGEILFGFLFWGSGLILLTYVISTVAKNPAGGISINIIIYSIFTFIIYNAIGINGLPFFLQYLHPTCILKFGISDYCLGKENNFVLALFLYCCVLFAFLVFKDSELLGRLVHSFLNKFVSVDYSLQEENDEFVEEEEEQVKKLINKRNFSSSSLIVNNLKRWYLKGFRAAPAVRGISFAVKKGECFGLLGVNGAGKTTTFKMLTGAISASHGSSYSCSERLSLFNRQKYLFAIGYCPQFGGLIPSFKGEELLTFFAQLRGIRGCRVKVEVKKWLEKLSLTDYAGKSCGTYSGGNQRKLSTAIALIGDSPLIFLDEPTTGVDPLSRRLIWNVIGDVRRNGQAIVLTSHSMDECEALCSRLAIMVNGRFRCIGETTTLKDRFRQGISIRLKLSKGAAKEEVESLKVKINNTLKPGDLVDDHVTMLQYHVTRNFTLIHIFDFLRKLKEEFSVLESYTVSSTTLEEIFIYFARNQGITV